MGAIISALSEGAKVSEVAKIKEISETGKIVLEPNIDIAQNKSLESIMQTNIDNDVEKLIKGIDENKEINLPIQNKIDGLKREAEVEQDLKGEYPEEEGYAIESEVYLRSENGNIVKDPVSGETRRIDFVVVKEGKVVDSIEVTSKTADKIEQSAKEERIRDAGGNYVKDGSGELVRIPDEVKTRIERRD